MIAVGKAPRQNKQVCAVHPGWVRYQIVQVAGIHLHFHTGHGEHVPRFVGRS